LQEQESQLDKDNKKQQLEPEEEKLLLENTHKF